MNDARVRVLLELDPALVPIGGTLSVDGRGAQPFSGWLALGRELDAALAAARPAAQRSADE